MRKLKHIFLIPVIISLFAISCEIDNYDGPNAKISGKFLDSQTGELVGTDIQQGNEIGVYEQGWQTEARQAWVVKNTGEYTNDMVFAATYRVVFTNCNFFPFTIDEFVVKEGNNTHDFEVTPYLRIINPGITYDAATQTVNATFNLQKGGDNVTLNQIRLYAFTDQWVGEYVKFNITDADAQKGSAVVGSTVDGTTQYTLSINVASYPNMFKYSRTYYFRIGALANVPDVGTVRRNYSPLVTIDITR
jgi:hypothetical protein